MRTTSLPRASFLCGLITIMIWPTGADAQPLKTPLDQEVLTLLSNEISGQMAFNNEVLLAGAPWLRDRAELEGTFYESEKIHEIVKSYGIETTWLLENESNRTCNRRPDLYPSPLLRRHIGIEGGGTAGEISGEDSADVVSCTR